MFSDSFNELTQMISVDLGLTQDDIGVPKINDIDNTIDITPPETKKQEDVNPVKFVPDYSMNNLFKENIEPKVVEKPTAKVNQNTNSNQPIESSEAPQSKKEAVSKFTKAEKEDVIASFITDQMYTKEFKLNGKLSVIFKTINDELQQQLNNELQVINITGDRRKHAYYYGNGTGEEYDTVFHVDQLRNKRLKILSYHLHSLVTNVIPNTQEGRSIAEKALLKLPTNLLNSIYEKAMVPFLNLVEEACNDIEVF